MPVLYDALRVSSAALEAELITLRRHLHANPERSWEEVQTAAHVGSLLASKGLKPGRAIARTGFFVDIHGTGRRPSIHRITGGSDAANATALPGDMESTSTSVAPSTQSGSASSQNQEADPIIAYRADMDALAIEDAKKTPYRSAKPGIAHLCGHDAHTTVAYGVACLLHEHRDKFRGTVRVFWQPAEETTPSGAPEMIKDGVLDGVKAVYGMHVDPGTRTGTVSLRHGADTASFDAFEITITAPSTTHSARPHTGKDTIWIASNLMQQLYQLSTRITDSRSAVVIAVSMIHGGNVLNVLPDTVTFGGTIRTSSEQERLRIRDFVEKLADHTATLHGVHIDVNLMFGAPPVQNHARLVDFARGVYANALGADNVLEREQSMGAEDFGYYSQHLPTLFTRVGSASGVETSFPLHAQHFDIDESILADASALQAFLLIEHLNSLHL